jgi:hypothetical protein
LSATSTPDQIWHQGSPNIDDFPEACDQFGSSLAIGDFNNDGYSDLAVGVIDENIDTIVNAGGVNVIYGSPSGLGTADNQLFHQDTGSIEDIAEGADRFGSVLAPG